MTDRRTNTGRGGDKRNLNDYPSKIKVMPTQWANLGYMSEVRPLDSSDVPCLEEIRRVLEKHGRLDRLGVTLLHRHFEIQDDEIMVEEIDFEDRALMVKPVKKEIAGKCVETSWQLNADDAVQACAKQHCYSTCIAQEKAFRVLMTKRAEAESTAL